MRRVYILVGNVGSGKSKWAAKNYERLNACIVSKDSIREMVHGEYIYREKQEKMIHEIAIQLCVTFMRQFKKNVIFDDANMTKKERLEIIKYIEKRRLVIPTNLEIKYRCLNFIEHGHNLEWRMKDNRGYSRYYWARVYQILRDQYQAPTMDEGYDAIEEVKHNEITYEAKKECYTTDKR